MTVIADPARTALLTAGMIVAEREGLHRLSVNAVVGEAGVAKGTFYHHFPSRSSFVIALHRRYYAIVSDHVTAAVTDMQPGVERIAVSMEAFLDACLRTRGAEAFMIQARFDPDLRSEVRASQERFVAVSRPDMAAVGWPDPDAAAELKVAIVKEICFSELDTRGPRRDLRAAAVGMLTGVEPRASVVDFTP